MIPPTHARRLRRLIASSLLPFLPTASPFKISVADTIHLDESFNVEWTKEPDDPPSCFLYPLSNGRPILQMTYTVDSSQASGSFQWIFNSSIALFLPGEYTICAYPSLTQNGTFDPNILGSSNPFNLLLATITTSTPTTFPTTTPSTTTSSTTTSTDTAFPSSIDPSISALPSPQSADNQSRSQAPFIIGGVLGAVICLLAILFLTYRLYRQRSAQVRDGLKQSRSPTFRRLSDDADVTSLSERLVSSGNGKYHPVPVAPQESGSNQVNPVRDSRDWWDDR